MVDTIRSFAAIQALLGDNIQQEISPQDLRDAVLTLYAASTPRWTDVAFVTGQQVRRPNGIIYEALADVADASGLIPENNPGTWSVVIDGDLTHDEQIRVLGNAIDAVNNEVQSQTSGGVEFFESSFTIDAGNIATFRNKNLIYNRADNQFTSVALPTDAVIGANGGHPFEIEFSHIGGTGRGLDNAVHVSVQAGPSDELINLPSSGPIGFVTMRKGDVLYLRKENGTAFWEAGFQTASAAAIAAGVFNLRTDIIITDPAAIGTLLAGATIVAGDAFLITVGGDYFGTTFGPNDIIVAEISNPDITTDSNDWTVVRNTRNTGGLSSKEILFLANVLQSGLRFDLTDNVFVDPVNIGVVTNTANGTLPQSHNLILGALPGSTEFTQDFSTDLNFDSIIGGEMRLTCSFRAQSQSGFLPRDVAIEFMWDAAAISITFDLSNLNTFGGRGTIRTDIPNIDYSAIAGLPPDRFRLTGTFEGSFYHGLFTISAWDNTRKGTLHDPIIELMSDEVALVRNQLQNEIDGLETGLDATESDVRDISTRVSPVRTVQTFSIDSGDARFVDTTPLDPFPADLSSFTRVDPGHQIFTAASTAVFVAVRGDIRHGYENTTANTGIIELSPANASVEPDIDLGVSVVDSGVAYFVYRITNILPGHELRVVELGNQTEIAWQADIDTLKAQVAEIRQFLSSHTVLNVPEEVAAWLANDISIVHTSAINFIPTPLNFQLGGGAQGVFQQAGVAAAPVPGFAESTSMDEYADAAPERGRKLVLLPLTDLTDGDAILRARTLSGGGTIQNLLVRNGSNLMALRNQPATPATTRNVTRYPLPSNQVRHDWFDIPTIETVNGIPVPAADELLFTRALPPSSTTLTIVYRGVSNGLVFGQASATLGGVGGSADAERTVTLNDGGETLTIRIRWRADRRDIVVDVTERVNQGLPTVSAVQVRLEWTESVTTPAQPARQIEVPVGTYAVGSIVPVFVGPSLASRSDGDASELIVVTSDGEVTTGFAYNTLFGAGDAGVLEVQQTDPPGTLPISYFDYNFAAHEGSAEALIGSVSTPYAGLFTVDSSSQTIAGIDTQVIAVDEVANDVNLAQEQILVAPDDTRWRLVVDISGNVSSTQVLQGVRHG